MKLQIERLIVWSKHDIPKRNEIAFKPECVNVLSGESRTGKSAVSSIIDYCLGSRDCEVPIGRVRENVSWYGIVIDTDVGRYLLARENPVEDNGSSVSCFFNEIDDKNPVPSAPPERNTSRNELIEKLADIAGITDARRGDYGAENARLSFRDLTHLLFQVQDIVANRYMLFYKMQRAEVMEKFSEWFNFIIGAETNKDVYQRQKLEEYQREQNQLKAELSRLSNKLQEFMPKLRTNLLTASELGLWDGVDGLPSDDQKLLALTEKVCGNGGQILNEKPASGQISKALEKLNAENEALAADLMSVENSLEQLDDLKNCVLEQNSTTGMIKDRLSISKWLLENAQKESAGVCPVCGEAGHGEAKGELVKIAAFVEKCEKAMEQAKLFPSASLAEVRRLESQKADLDKKISANEKQIDELLKARASADRRYFERQKTISSVLATLKMILELNKAIADEEKQKRLAELDAEIAAIKSVFDEKTIKEKEERFTQEICDLALKRLKTLDCENQYRINAPVFKKRDMNICVCDMKKKPHPLGQVGSASNWVALHVAFTCALQEFFAAQKNPRSCVPNFMVYDQPSQVYFPSGKRDQKDPHAKAEAVQNQPIKEDDIIAARKIFSTLNDSIRETKAATGSGWQAIVLEHADKDIYGEIEGINILAPWRDGKALIPHDWYEEADEQQG